MTSKIKVDNIENQCGGAVVTKCGGTTTISGSVVKANNIQASDGGNLVSQSGTTITLGASGDTINLASGVSQSGFGRTGTVDWQTAIKTGDFTAVSGEGYFVNTTSGVITMTLPASPSVGDIVSVKDYAQTFDSNALTVGRNSQPIEGGAFDLVLTAEGSATTLVYGDATKGWQSVNSNEITNSIKFVSATGGTETTSGDFRIHTFTGPGTFTVNCGGNPAGSSLVDYLILAGGGGGNPQTNGGGGAGGYRESSGAASGCYTASPLGSGVSGLPVSAQPYPITVGAGGGAGPGATSGSDSVFSSITSAGGGKTDTNGGSGGGSATSGNPAGVGNTPPVSPPQGTNGGTGIDNKAGSSGSKRGGGGGGALVAALNQPPSVSPAADRAGGAGATSSINGTPTTRGGGGGGGSEWSPSTGNFGASPGGAGGGGDGGIDPSPGNVCATAGGTNLGGGGGGGGDGKNGAAGGSGIVIIRYKFQ